MNIAIGKFGKSVIFDDSRWGAIGGDNEAPTLFLKIADLHPDNTYYMIGKSNFRKMPDDFKAKHPNIVDVWQWYDKEKYNNTSFIYDILAEKGISIDIGLFYSGPTSNSNIKNVIVNKNGSFAKPLEMFLNYVGPIIYFLNKSMIKYLLLTVDARYNPIKAMDLFNRPIKILSQYDEVNEANHILSFDNNTTITSTKEITTYNGIEKVVLIGKKKFSLQEVNRSKKMTIILNEGGGQGTKSRYPILKEYVLDNFNDVDIYGKWDEKYYVDSRFKGPKKFIELENLLKDVKYTFIIPIQTGWATAKFWEMANFGVIPFMHSTYDMHRHIKCPDFLRVTSPKDFIEKIEILEKDNNRYLTLLNEIHAMLEDGYYDGSIIVNEIYKEISKIFV